MSDTLRHKWVLMNYKRNTENPEIVHIVEWCYVCGTLKSYDRMENDTFNSKTREPLHKSVCQSA